MDSLILTIPLNGNAKEEIDIVPLGTWWRYGREMTISRAMVDRMVERFSKRKIPVVIDYEHQTLYGSKAPAGGWIQQVMSSDTGLKAKVQWVGSAQKEIEGGEYAFISPVIFWQVEDRDTGLMEGPEIQSCGLTNDPFFQELPPLAASNLAARYRSMYGKAEAEPQPQPQTLAWLGELKRALGVERDEEVGAALKTRLDTVSFLKGKVADLNAEVLLAQYSNRITPANRATYLEMARKNPDQLREVMKDVKPLPLGRVDRPEGENAVVLSATEAVVARNLGLTPEQFRSSR